MEFVPYVSLGNIRLGMSRIAARQQLGPDFQSFQKTPDTTILTDAYNQLGLHLYYDADDEVEYIEAFEGANLRFQGIELLGRELTDLISEFSAIGFRLLQDDYGGMCEEAGICFTAPDGLVEGIGVFRKGYYES